MNKRQERMEKNLEEKWSSVERRVNLVEEKIKKRKRVCGRENIEKGQFCRREK